MHPKPTKEDIRDALNRTVDDLIGYDLRVLFCGINPGIWSGATGLHFAKPGNRFWKALHLSGITARQLHPSEGHELLELGYGITCFVGRTTARADEITLVEYILGGKIVEKKVHEYRPKILAVLGLGAYRSAYGRRDATLGIQRETIGDTRIWLLPNPSGLNAHYQLADFAALFTELKNAVK